MKIGIFDSGLGGLTVARQIRARQPQLDLYYVADTVYAPYGSQTKATIITRSLAIAKYLFTQVGVDALVVACNSATTAAIVEVRAAYPDKVIVGTEPGVKVAAQQSKTGVVGVLATPATLSSDKYKSLVSKFNLKVKVHEQACVGLVEQIEQGRGNSEGVRAMLASWIEPMKKKGVDVLVLGCTHYPIIQGAIQSVAGGGVFLVDTSKAITKRLESQLDITKPKDKKGKVAIFATSEINEKMLEIMLNAPVKVEKIKI